MNPRVLELALKKQRLQWQIAAQREELGRFGAGLAPALGAADRVREGARWLRRHPEAVAAGVTALVVARPRVVWRWARRGFFAWQAWRKLQGVVVGRFARS